MIADDAGWIHVALPSGGTALVKTTAAPETLAALDKLLRTAAASLEADTPTEEGANDVNCCNL